jgi:phage baseplate assembly protein W
MKAFTYPFTLDPFGVADTSEVQGKIYKDRIVTLLSTAVGTRPMRPTYGTNLAKAMFENQDDSASAIRSTIKAAISLWIPEVQIDSIDIRGVQEDGRMLVDLIVILPDYTLASLAVSSVTLTPTGNVTR